MASTWSSWSRPGQSFRLVALVIYACAGILLIRMVSRGRAHLWVASGALALALVIFLGDKVGGPQLHPYTGSYQVLLFNLFTAVAICEFTRLVAERWKFWLEPLTEVGGMWLTMYVAMTLSTAAYLQLAPPGSRDDSWGCWPAWSWARWCSRRLGAVAREHPLP